MVSLVGGSEINSLEVRISGTAAGLERALDNAIASLNSFKGAVAATSAAIGVGAAAALGKAADAAASYEEMMVEVEKVTNPETAREMGRAIRGMANQMPVAHKELANIAAIAGRLGVSGKKNIREFTRVTAMMATATDLTANEAADSFARMSKLMELPIADAEKLGSAVNELSNNMGASASEIVNAATRSSGVLTQLGLRENDILSLNAAMNEVSASSRIAGTQLRRFAQEIQDPGKTEDFANALGMTVTKFRELRQNNPRQLIKRMTKEFKSGGESAKQLKTVLGNTSRQTLSKLAQNWASVEAGTRMANQEFERATSLQAEYNTAASTTNAQLEITKNKLANLAITTGEVLLPAINALLGGLNRVLGRLVAFNKRTEGMAGAITGVVGVIGGFGTSLALLASQLGIASSTVSALGTALSALTGPVGIAAVAIAGLATAWMTDFMGIRTATMKVVNDINTVLMPAVRQMQTDIQAALAVLRQVWQNQVAKWAPIIQRAMTMMQDAIQGTLAFIHNTLIQPTLRALNRLWKRHGNEITAEVRETWAVIKERITQVWTFLKPFIESGMAFLRQTISTGLNRIQAFWERWGDEITTLVSFAFDAIVGTVSFAVDTLLTTISVALDLVQGDWREAWTKVKNYLERTLNGILTFVTKWGGRFTDYISGILADIWTEFVAWANDLIFGSLITDMFDAILAVTRSRMEKMQNAITAAVKGAYDRLKSWFGEMLSTAKAVIGSLASWLRTDAASDLASAASNAGTAAARSLKNRFNAFLPDRISVPSVTIGGDTLEIPSIDVGGETFGGGSLSVPSETIGGQSLQIPKLDTGGFVEESGLAQIHQGEMVLPAAEVDRSRSESGDGDVHIHIDSINADGYRSGRAAARGFKDQLRSYNFD